MQDPSPDKDDDVSQFMVRKRKLSTSSTSPAQFQENNNTGQQEVHEYQPRLKGTKAKSLAQKTQFRVHTENGHQEAYGDISKFKVPENKILIGTSSIAHFQEYHGIAQPQAHDDGSNSKIQTGKILCQASHLAQLQAESEIGPKEAPKIPKERKKSKNSIRGLGSLGSHVNGLEECSQLTKSTKKYQTLRRKYLNLEKESSILEDELKKSESQVEILEKEKNALLDKLVVLEGLVDPSDFEDDN